MRVLFRTDADAELLVRGEAPPGADPELIELAALMRGVRDLYARSPIESIAEGQVEAMLAEAAAISAGSAVAVGRSREAAMWIPPARRGTPHVFRLAAIGLATLLATAGMAIAGVKPPGLDRALERIGIGGGEKEAQPAGTGASGASENGARRDGATRERGGDRNRGAKATGQGEPGARGQGEENRSETGTINSAPGRATAEEARSGQTPPQSPGRSDDHAPEGTGPPASPGSQGGGADTGASRSEGKREFGQGIAEQARERRGRPESLGGP